MDDPPTPSDGLEAGRDADHTPRIGLGIDNRRNRELLSELLSEYEVVELEDCVGSGTDLCIVDPGGFDRLSADIERWKAEQRPAAAPALLLANAPEPAIWDEYADAMGRKLDAVQSIPVPKRAILARVRGLLQTRRFSRAAKERHERLELYERAMNGANVGITIADAGEPDLPLVYVNDSFEAITGYGPAESLGRNCRFLQGEGTDQRTVDRIREALEAEEAVSVEILNYRADGEPFWNDLEVVPVTDGDGEVTHFLGFQDDITERRRREADLERYEQVLQSIDDPVVVSDDEQRVKLFNDAAAELLGDGEGLETGTPVPGLFPDTVRSDVRRALADVERSGEPQECQLALPAQDGGRRVFQFRFQRERNTADRPISRTIVVGRDVTTLREYQNRLSVLDRVLRHNLRNKLTVIAGNAELLVDEREELPSETVADIVDSIDAAVADLLDLTEAARQFHRSIEPTDRRGATADLPDLLEEVVTAARRQYPDADIELDATEPIAATVPSTLRLGLDGIIENAVEYATSAEPRVVVTVLDRPEEGVAEIRIADDGPGIPEREREALRRGGETALEHLQGITLWLVSWAVRGVGGEFRVNDRDPSGTVVVLRLPRAET
jgi:PAS domain S-box-containing protein